MSSQSDSKSSKDRSSSSEKKSSKKDEQKPKHEHRRHSNKKDKCEKPTDKKEPCVDKKGKCVDKKEPCSDKKDKKDACSDKKDKCVDKKEPCVDKKDVCPKPVDKKDKCDRHSDKRDKHLHFLDKFVFTSSVSKIMVPLGSTIMKVFMLGGGGGGGAYIPACENLRGAGGGGGAGSYINSNYCVHGGKYFDVVIGAGGQGGNSDNKNGQDGSNTTLTYDCQAAKVAEAGKGGMLNLNGGVGGKGGAASSCGERGHNGRDGDLNGRGGAGGNAPGHFGHHFGKGGGGGSNPCPPPCPPTPPHHRRQHDNHQHTNCDVEDSCAVGPNGQDGNSGYCEVSFFSEHASRDNRHQVPQHIVSTNSSIPYWANPDTDLITIDTSDFAAYLNLGRPAHDWHRVTFRLQHQQALAAYITTFSGGTFVLDSANAEVTLLYSEGVWNVSTNFQGISSFFPTTQEGSVHCLDNFCPSGASFVTSVDISADGQTLAVGTPSDNKDVGATYIYVLQDRCWKKQAKVIGTLGVGVQKQGVSVALSADGNTLAVGGNQDNSGIGAVWIFVRNNCKWSQQESKIVDTTPGNAGQGSSVDLSADGNTLVVGAPYTSPSGKFFVYTRSGTTWTQTASFVNLTNVIPLVSPTTPANSQGMVVSLSADASLLAVGATDTVYVYTLIAGVLQPNPNILQPAVLGLNYGYALDLAANGRTLAVGEYGFSSGQGQVYVYVNDNGVWTLQGLPVQGSPAVTGGAQGFAVALTADGNTLAIGSPYDGSNNGAVWIFTRSAGVWVQREKLVAPPLNCNAEQGASLALSSEGTHLVVGNDVPSGIRPLFWTWM